MAFWSTGSPADDGVSTHYPGVVQAHSRMSMREPLIKDGIKHAAVRNTHCGDFPDGGRPAVAGERVRTVTGLARGRATCPTSFCWRLEAGDPRNAQRRLGSIKSNLNPARVERIKRSIAQMDVTEGLQ
jgi:hypothetical protein